MSKASISWKDVAALKPQWSLVFKVLLVIVLLDFLVSIALSNVLSGSFYLKRFLADDYEEVVSDYYNQQYFIEPNKEAGWVNTANLRQEGDKWHTDSLGARISPQQAETDARHKLFDDRADLVFLLGSSVLNGFTLDYNLTPDSYLNEYGYHAFNFASALYTIDQSYALYKNELSQYKPATLIVGIHDDAEVASNMFAAFRDIGDKHSPFLKPAYRLSEGELVKTMPPYAHQSNGELAMMLTELEKNDADYYKFDYFKRLSLLPFSDLIRQAILKVSRKFYNTERYKKDVELQKSIMSAIVDFAKQDGTEVIFVKLEGLYNQEKSLYNRLFNQYLHQDKNALHNQLLKETAFNILYISELFRDSGEPISKFYLDDQLHLSAEGSELLAKRVNQELHKLRASH